MIEVVPRFLRPLSCGTEGVFARKRGGDVLRKVVLYISLSLDGYIADVGGDVGWLGGQDPDYTGDYGY